MKTFTGYMHGMAAGSPSAQNTQNSITIHSSVKTTSKPYQNGALTMCVFLSTTMF